MVDNKREGCGHVRGLYRHLYRDKPDFRSGSGYNSPDRDSQTDFSFVCTTAEYHHTEAHSNGASIF